MVFSARANVKHNRNPNDSNDQWLPVQLGSTVTNDWAWTLSKLNPESGQMPLQPLQWTSVLTAVTVSEALDYASLEAPVSYYFLAEKGARSNPNEYIILSVQTSEAAHTKHYNRQVALFPDGIFIGFASDRNILEDADIPGRASK